MTFDENNKKELADTKFDIINHTRENFMTSHERILEW